MPTTQEFALKRRIVRKLILGDYKNKVKFEFIANDVMQKVYLIQNKPNINPFIKVIVFPVFPSFIAEPFLIWIGLYQPLNWKHIYSFPIYIGIYLLTNYISKREDLGNNRLIIIYTILMFPRVCGGENVY
ncbi:hypothetical protein [Metabacillus bambusae]|uniref:Uncharacterized protein n=1 Tax=Metabacillus bambusae TaxID=2795218 RepID=A0ABS3MYV4_9BACI|nr:hypothetical protein [Metabacillus bambusae]MBO1511202.1 hypothetical protein [Metabacillus bambusae]